ncbi:MAG: ABC transporter ATP-binding protein [Angustibacter sp.]
MTGSDEPTPVLRVHGLCKAFGGVPVVEGLTFTVAPGEIVALVGANGVGKTTALRCVVGADTADSGDVALLGAPYDEADGEVRRRVCSLLDDFAWLPELTVSEHLELYARAFGSADAAGVVEAAMAELDVHHLADRLPGTLSSGQTRRFALAQALVRPWSLLVLDEPEQRLDADGRAWLAGWLRREADRGRAVLLASHDPTLLTQSGASVVALEGHGRAG